ncbi:MAG: hypothetical protein Q9201_005934 [Fulgogasparrea decipioides]
METTVCINLDKAKKIAVACTDTFTYTFAAREDPHDNPVIYGPIMWYRNEAMEDFSTLHSFRTLVQRRQDFMEGFKVGVGNTMGPGANILYEEMRKLNGIAKKWVQEMEEIST